MSDEKIQLIKYLTHILDGGVFWRLEATGSLFGSVMKRRKAARSSRASLAGGAAASCATQKRRARSRAG